MDLQENMFNEVDAWRESGLTKQAFLQDKDYSLMKC
jgi:hypothetical protein